MGSYYCCYEHRRPLCFIIGIIIGIAAVNSYAKLCVSPVVTGLIIIAIMNSNLIVYSGKMSLELS